MYGITTGFGKFSDVTISKEKAKLFQKNLIVTHAVGVRKLFAKKIVRGIMLLRINSLAKGFCGIRLETLETLIEMLNKRVHPIIPEKGSLGASGDLAPLSHMVLPMIGFGVAEYKGKVIDKTLAMTSVGALDNRIYQLRPHKGQIDTAKIILQSLKDSNMTSKQGEIRV